MMKPGAGGRATDCVFASGEVCELARISPRQLQWWDEQNVLSPMKDGHRRLYRFEDVIGIMVIGELRRKGLSLQKIRRVARFFRREVGSLLAPALRSGCALELVTDGNSAYVEQGPEAIINRLKKAREAMFLVSVSDQVRRLDEFQKAQGTRFAHDGQDQLRLF